MTSSSTSSNVTKQFPGVTALSDVTFQVRRGEIHGLCGENGAGKSTLMKILSGVYPSGPTRATILYDGKELKLTDRSIRQAIEEGIAIVYQELTLVPSMTVGENIYLGKEPVERGSINWDKLYVEHPGDPDEIPSGHPAASHRQVPGRRQDADDRDRQSALGECQDPDPRRADQRPLRGRSRQIDGDPARRSRSTASPASTSPTNWKSSSASPTPITVLRDGKVVTTQPTKDLSVEKLVSYMVGREMKERFPKGNRKPGRRHLRSRRSPCARSRRSRTAKCSKAYRLTSARAKSWVSPA